MKDHENPEDSRCDRCDSRVGSAHLNRDDLCDRCVDAEEEGAMKKSNETQDRTTPEARKATAMLNEMMGAPPSDLVEREAVLGAVRYDDAGRLREKVVSLIEALPPAPLPERVQAAVDLAEAAKPVIKRMQDMTDEGCWCDDGCVCGIILARDELAVARAALARYRAARGEE